MAQCCDLGFPAENNPPSQVLAAPNLFHMRLHSPKQSIEDGSFFVRISLAQIQEESTQHNCRGFGFTVAFLRIFCDVKLCILRVHFIFVVNDNNRILDDIARNRNGRLLPVSDMLDYLPRALTFVFLGWIRRAVSPYSTRARRRIRGLVDVHIIVVGVVVRCCVIFSSIFGSIRIDAVAIAAVVVVGGVVVVRRVGVCVSCCIVRTLFAGLVGCGICGGIIVVVG
mmetsp:Transcript_26805/g.75217  ORF Transcript_26805/g.75217 Transcript_26805/m.75217 type:complete len:225 (-) Transcript_26805:1435-2109(-)